MMLLGDSQAFEFRTARLELPGGDSAFLWSYLRNGDLILLFTRDDIFR